MARYIGTLPKHIQIRYAELGRRMRQAEAILDEDIRRIDPLDIIQIMEAIKYEVLTCSSPR